MSGSGLADFGSSELILKSKQKRLSTFHGRETSSKSNLSSVYQTTATTDNPSTENLKDRAISEVVEPYTGLTTDFHSLLYDNLAEVTRDEKGDRKGLKPNNSVQLWYLVRLLDKQGTGWVDIDLDRAAVTLKRGVKTVKRHIKQGLAKGLFRHAYKIAPGRWRIYYTSLFKVAAIAGLDNWGATVEITEADLPRLKLLAAEMTAKAVQSQSRFVASKKHKRVPTVVQMLNSSLCCRGVKGQKIRRSKRFVSVTADMPTFGGTQAKFASLLGRHWQTVCRRLSNNARAKHDLPPITRRQILRESKEAALAIRGRLPILRTDQNKKVFSDGRDRAFISRPNVYAFDLTEDEINMTRKQRKALKMQAAIANSTKFPDRHLKSKKLTRYKYKRHIHLTQASTLESLINTGNP